MGDVDMDTAAEQKGSARLSLLELLLRERFSYSKPTGFIHVEHVRGKSVATQVCADYPLQFMVPKKAIPANVDSVLVYVLTFGGGIVSGDAISCEMTLRRDATAALATQGCTNVFKNVNGKTSRQMLKARVESGALLAVLPDALVCYAEAKYSQVQAFDLAPDANLVVVDWMASGRIARGECWTFDCFESINHIYVDGNIPVLLDSVRLDRGSGLPLMERMDDFHVIGLLVIYGPRLAAIRKLVQAQVQRLADEALNNRPSSSSLWSAGGGREDSAASGEPWPKRARLARPLYASCSPLGPADEGLVVRWAAKDTKMVYQFLREQLSALQPLLGILPYTER